MHETWFACSRHFSKVFPVADQAMVTTPELNQYPVPERLRDPATSARASSHTAKFILHVTNEDHDRSLVQWPHAARPRLILSLHIGDSGSVALTRTMRAAPLASCRGLLEVGFLDQSEVPVVPPNANPEAAAAIDEAVGKESHHGAPERRATEYGGTVPDHAVPGREKRESLRLPHSLRPSRSAALLRAMRSHLLSSLMLAI